MPRQLDDEAKLEVIEGCLYRLKERDYLNPSQVRQIDDFMARVGAEALVDLYDLVRYHDGPEPG